MTPHDSKNTQGWRRPGERQPTANGSHQGRVSFYLQGNGYGDDLDRYRKPKQYSLEEYDYGLIPSELINVHLQRNVDDYYSPYEYPGFNNSRQNRYAPSVAKELIRSQPLGPNSAPMSVGEANDLRDRPNPIVGSYGLQAADANNADNDVRGSGKAYRSYEEGLVGPDFGAFHEFLGERKHSSASEHHGNEGEERADSIDVQGGDASYEMHLNPGEESIQVTGQGFQGDTEFTKKILVNAYPNVYDVSPDLDSDENHAQAELTTGKVESVINKPYDSASSGRGKLKLFIGAAPGAGKTFAMLDEALTYVRRGSKVVIAGIERYDNSDTEHLLRHLKNEGAIFCSNCLEDNQAFPEAQGNFTGIESLEDDEDSVTASKLESAQQQLNSDKVYLTTHKSSISAFAGASLGAADATLVAAKAIKRARSRNDEDDPDISDTKATSSLDDATSVATTATSSTTAASGDVASTEVDVAYASTRNADEVTLAAGAAEAGAVADKNRAAAGADKTKAADVAEKTRAAAVVDKIRAAVGADKTRTVAAAAQEAKAIVAGAGDEVESSSGEESLAAGRAKSHTDEIKGAEHVHKAKHRWHNPDEDIEDEVDCFTVHNNDWADSFVDAVTTASGANMANSEEEVVELRTHSSSETKALDVERIIAQKPDLVIVDDFAANNPLGAVRKNRWQDIEILLNAGINVFSALDIQQLDVLNSLVARVTGCEAEATVPVVVFDAADEVNFVDTSADEIIHRINLGKVSFPESWGEKAESYKKKSTLIALRDLTLRQLRLREVAHERFAFRTVKSVSSGVLVPAHMLLILNTGTTSESVQRCADLAHGRSANWHCIWVKHRSLTNFERRRINDLLEMAQSLGAITEVLVGNFYDAVSEYAKSNAIVTLAVAPGHKNPFRRMRYTKLAKMLPDVNLLFLPEELKRDSWLKRAALLLESGAGKGMGIWQALLANVIVTIAMFPLYSVLRNANIVMCYLLLTFWFALKFNVVAAVFSSAISVIVFDVCFTAPHGRLAINDFQSVVTFLTMVTVSIVTSRLLARNIQMTKTAQLKERHTRIMYDAARSAATAVDELRVFHTTAAILHSELKVECEFWICHDKSDKLECIRPRLLNVDAKALQHCFVTREECGAGRYLFSDSPYLYMPLSVRDNVYGVAVMCPDSMLMNSLPEIQRLLAAIVSQVAQTIDALHSIEEARQSILTMEADRLRNSLLQSLSHDLRTPLTSLMNNAENMLIKLRHKEYDVAESSAEEIIDSAQRMITLMTNLLEMARLQNDGITLNKTWIPAEELIGLAKAAHKNRIDKYIIKTIIDDDCPMFYGDPVLLERVGANLLDNAMKYCPPGSIIQFHAWGDDKQCSIRLEDNGPGLPDNIESRLLFDPFKRGHSESNVAGVGLGLAICNTIAKVHDAQLIAEKSELGGAAFTLVMKTEPMPELEDEEEMLEKIAAQDDLDDLFPIGPSPEAHTIADGAPAVQSTAADPSNAASNAAKP